MVLWLHVFKCVTEEHEELGVDSNCADSCFFLWSSSCCQAAQLAALGFWAVDFDADKEKVLHPHNATFKRATVSSALFGHVK